SPTPPANDRRDIPAVALENLLRAWVFLHVPVYRRGAASPRGEPRNISCLSWFPPAAHCRLTLAGAILSRSPCPRSRRTKTLAAVPARRRRAESPTAPGRPGGLQ